MVDSSLFEIEKAKHDEAIAFSEMELAKTAYEVSKKKYSRAKYVLDSLLTIQQNTVGNVRTQG